MELSLIGKILAIVTTDKEKIIGGDAPIFWAQDDEQAQHISLLLSRILKAMVHDLENGIYILVKH